MKRLLIILVFIFSLVSGILYAQAPVILEKRFTPFSAVEIAAKDIQTQAQPTYTRYLSLHYCQNDKELKQQTIAVVNLVCNSLSTERIITQVIPIPPNDPVVLRVDITKYGWDSKIWDNLAEKGSGPRPLPEPYFNLDSVIVIDQEYGHHDAYGKWVTTRIEKEKKRQLIAAPWLSYTDSGATISTLIKYSQAKFPILRADWFIVNASVAPAYYDFLKLGKKEKDFEALSGLDRKKVQDKQTVTQGNVVISEVATSNRILKRYPTVNHITSSSYWESLDHETSVDEDDVVLDLLNEKFAAKEIIASLKNGLSAYFVVNAKDERLDAADPNIAQDYNTKLRDKTIRVGYSCMHCHGLVDGFRYVDDFVRDLSSPPFSLRIADEKKYKQVQEIFGYNLRKVVEFDKSLYSESVKAATGQLPLQVVTSLEDIILSYNDIHLDDEIIANECGLTTKGLIEKIKQYPKADPRLLGLIKRPNKPVRKIRRDHFERVVFPEAMKLLKP